MFLNAAGAGLRGLLPWRLFFPLFLRTCPDTGVNISGDSAFLLGLATLVLGLIALGDDVRLPDTGALGVRARVVALDIGDFTLGVTTLGLGVAALEICIAAAFGVGVLA